MISSSSNIFGGQLGASFLVLLNLCGGKLISCLLLLRMGAGFSLKDLYYKGFRQKPLVVILSTKESTSALCELLAFKFQLNTATIIAAFGRFQELLVKHFERNFIMTIPCSKWQSQLQDMYIHVDIC